MTTNVPLIVDCDTIQRLRAIGRYEEARQLLTAYQTNKKANKKQLQKEMKNEADRIRAKKIYRAKVRSKNALQRLKEGVAPLPFPANNNAK